MAAVTITMSHDVSKLTDREALQTYVCAIELHDHLCGDAPYPECLQALHNELSRRGYIKRWLADMRGISLLQFCKERVA